MNDGGRGGHGASGYEADGHLAGDPLEGRSIEGEHLPAVALGAGDDRGVGEAEGGLGEPSHQLPDPRHVGVAAIEQRVALLEAPKEPDGCDRAETPAENV